MLQTDYKDDALSKVPAHTAAVFEQKRKNTDCFLPLLIWLSPLWLNFVLYTQNKSKRETFWDCGGGIAKFADSVRGHPIKWVWAMEKTFGQVHIGQ